MPRTPEQIYDELLVLRCQDGESAAFEELVRRWQERLWRYSRRLVDDSEAAWDVVQEAWMAIVRGIGRLDDPARFQPWAYRVVTHKCADWTRRTARRRRLTEEVSHQPLEPAAPAEAEEDEIARLRRAIAGLPAERRALLTLHYLEGIGIAEIAVVLGIPQGTVKSRLFHARNALKTSLERSVS